MTLKRPMLAIACDDLSKVSYPVMLSPKLDGIRMLVKDGVCYSRSMKPIPSGYVQEKYGKSEYNGYDGELIYGPPTAKNVFNLTTSFCMSHNVPEHLDETKIGYYVFDRWDIDDVWLNRQNYYSNFENNVFCVRHNSCHTQEEVLKLEDKYISDGYEGIMLRKKDSPYKQGRSTLKEGYLLKIKRFKDDEAVITGFYEKKHNTNEAKTNELGYTNRSTAKEGMVGANTLGGLIAEHPTFGEIEIGSGFDDVTRKEIWNNQQDYLGKLVKFKYFEVGVIDKPRFPIYLGIRMEEDV